MSDSLIAILVCCILIVLYYVYFRIVSHKEIDKYKSQSITLYLDRVFIGRMINRLTDTQPLGMCGHDIVKYFLLDNLLLFNKDGDKIYSDNDVVEASISHYVKKNISEILKNLSQKDFFIVEKQESVSRKKVYVSFISAEKDCLVLYVLSETSDISKDEIEILTGTATAILNIAYVLDDRK